MLKWFSRQEQWLTESEIRQRYKKFEDDTFKSMQREKLISKRLSDRDGEWCEYRINDAGYACLERHAAHRWEEARGWMTAIISLVSFLSGVILSDPLRQIIEKMLKMIGQ